MRRLGLTSLFIVAVIVVANGQAKTDRELASLIGPVKTVNERSARYRGQRLEPRDTVTYDLNGNEIERVMVSDFGELIGTQTRTFAAAGLLQKSTITIKRKVQSEEQYLYEAGKLTQILVYDAKGVLQQKTTKIYDKNERILEEKYYDPETERAKTTFRYDENGNLVEIAFFLSGGQEAIAPVGPCLGAHRVTYKYDSRNRIVGKAAFETNGKEKKSWTYDYNEHGNYSLYTIKSATSTTRMTYSYEYDAKRNWTKSTVVSEADDNLLESMLKATGEKVTPEELRAMKESSKITSVTVREITYYQSSN